MKKKIRIEYPLNPSSGSIIWATISTPSGLQRWFADKVSRTESFIRFHWADEDTKTFFELKMNYNELTSDYLLEVTDFADPGEEEDVRSLWDSQIEVLRRVCGL